MLFVNNTAVVNNEVLEGAEEVSKEVGRERKRKCVNWHFGCNGQNLMNISGLLILIYTYNPGKFQKYGYHRMGR